MRSEKPRSTDDVSGHRTRFGAHNTILDKPPTAVLTWLEEHSTAVEQFDEEHNTETTEYFSRIPNATAIRTKIAASIKHNTTNAAPQSKPGGANFMVAGSDEEGTWNISLHTGKRLFGAEVVQPESSLDWWYPSPEGNYVAFGVSWNGDEQSVLHVWSVEAATLQPLTVPHCSFSKIAWLPNEEGFFFSAGLASDHERTEKLLKFARRVQGEFTVQESNISSIVIDDPYVSPHVSPDGNFVALTWSWERPATPHLFNVQTGEWEPFLTHFDSRGFGRFTDDSFFLLTTDNAPKGRIVRVPLASHTNPSTYEEVVPESNAVLRSLLPLPGGDVLVSELVNGFSRLRLVQASGEQHVIELPPFSLIVQESGLDTSPFYPQNNRVYFRLVSYAHPAVQAHLDLATGEVHCGEAPALHLHIERFVATAADGTEVPYVQLSKPGNEHSEAPTVLYGYGGWNLLPGPFPIASLGFDRFIEAGGHLVVANLRGGGEFGNAWWEDGRREHKQHTFDDFGTVANDIIRRGITAPSILGAWGRSNGGLLTAAAAVQFPELFRAIVTEVPLTDMARSMLHPYLSSYREEYGDPEDPAMLETLLAYSPVHNVQAGTAYPAVFALAGKDDLRCQPWNARKFTKLLQNATTSEHPVLMRVAPGGHGGDLTLENRIERASEVLLFFFHELPFQSPLSLT